MRVNQGPSALPSDSDISPSQTWDFVPQFFCSSRTHTMADGCLPWSPEAGVSTVGRRGVGHPEAFDALKRRSHRMILVDTQLLLVECDAKGALFR